ncbi:UDP-4-amino-4,6-dideoxy-N-acetyl-beta-L-altrosamine N-acetyltransferase [Alteromonadaceae bacterium M269]|nr:UDP-4-amino-4,6-dideoxy-N-acetyl-beta-L-altrosamine N-acetyltransferase [Alteromonadaceae bacterium M269]
MTKQYPTNCFTRLSESELECVLAWRNTDRVRGNMHSDEVISWEQHVAWFSKLENDATREFWILRQNSRPIGVLNFSGIGSTEIEWGCYLGETNVWPGSGILLEVAALDRATKLKPAEKLVAEVLSFNKSAIGLHKLFEYPQVSNSHGGVRNGEEYNKLYYEYPLSLWEQKKETLLMKLPKSLRALVETIEFRE